MHIIKSKEVLIIAGIGIVCFFPGCAKAPATELAAAKAAVKAAQDAEADKYMANNFLNLQKALEAAEAEVAKQNQSLFLTRKYTRATELLTKTTQFATDLQNEAPKAKEAAVTQVKENLGLVKGILQETADDIKKASRSKDKKAIIAELKADLSSADSVAALAAAEFKAGNVLKASDNLAEVQKLVKKITDALNPKPEM